MFLLFIATTLAASNVSDLYQCEPLGDMPGPEDFDWIPNTLVVSASERRPGESTDRNGIYLIQDDQQTLATFEGRDSCSFRPHGLALEQSADGAWQLYVINHHSPDDATLAGCTLGHDGDAPLLDSVEHYTLDGQTLRFVERLGDPLLQDPNDLDVAPNGTLYISNNPDLSPGHAVRLILARATPSTLVRYTPGAGFDVFADDFFYANGVYVAPDGAILLSAYSGNIYAFSPDGTELDHTVLNGALDNFLPDDRGGLWLTGHPSTRKFLAHVKDPSGHSSPSEIFHLTWSLDHFSLVKTYEEDGSDAAAVSTALMLDDNLILAQVFRPGLVSCTPK